MLACTRVREKKIWGTLHQYESASEVSLMSMNSGQIVYHSQKVALFASTRLDMNYKIFCTGTDGSSPSEQDWSSPSAPLTNLLA
mmetsp:Transcript_57462/g.171438  ORF Transcript_57462/g.171438 Transcript_57462/m.171438 type:complete len:84 (-) Transcript_57462:143-394(-)